MGIYDFYFNWLKTNNFVDIFRQNFPPAISSLSIDGNAIIHKCAQLVYGYGDEWKNKYGKDQATTIKAARQRAIKSMSDSDLEEELRIAIGNKILELVTAVNPVEYFFFAIDGSIPQAKITQQRSRRFKNVKVVEEEPASEVDSIIVEAEEKFISRFNTAAITPGTTLMINIDNYLKKFFLENINMLARTVYYSPHTVVGEGEHKIMDFFRSKKIKGDDFHVVYGMDTDLVLLTMGLNIPNIILWRDDIRERLYIDNFKFELTQKMGNSPSATDDFILIMNMAGNDFLPAIPAIEDFKVHLNIVLEIYEKIYIQYKLQLTIRENGKLLIEWKNFNYFLLNLKEHETFMLNFKLQNEYLKRDSLDYATTDTNESGESIPIQFNYDRFRNYWYHSEFAPRGNVDKIVEKIPIESLSINVDLINKMALDYLNGIRWVTEYYFNGWKGANLNWYYRYYRAPLFQDLQAAVNTMIATKQRISDWEAKPDNKFLNVFEQLLSVLPPVSKGLLPKEVAILMEPDSVLADYYPSDFLVEYELKDRDYKGVPILPFVNPDRIRAAYKSHVRFGPEREEYLKYFLNNGNKGWTRNPQQDKLICDTRQFKQDMNKSRDERGGGNRGRGRGRGGAQNGERRTFTPQLTPNDGGVFGNIPKVDFKI
jgi:5'-3' exoribonuclease 1